MWPLTLAFLQIAVHRRGPDVLPASRFLFAALLVGYLLASLVWFWTLALLGPRLVLFLLVDCALFLGCVAALLTVFRRQRRFLQTGAALLGIDVVLTATGILSTAIVRTVLAAAAPETTALVVDIVRIVLMIWWIDIASYVVSRAVNQVYVAGLAFVILYWMLSLTIGASLLPASS